MSQKSKLNRKRREEKQERQARKVFTWIVISLLVLAVLITAFYAYMLS